MIRFFGLFCKINFLNITGKDFFLLSMKDFRPDNYPCPFCSAKHPDWKEHDTYERYFICFEKGKSISYLINISRYKCSYCNHTHAILPEFLIPYRSYSLLFIILVMKDYFNGNLTVEKICSKYDIAVSTLYSWKELFFKHHQIWFHLLEKAYTSLLESLELFFNNFQHSLQEFFLVAGISFLQSYFKKAHSPPV